MPVFASFINLSKISKSKWPPDRCVPPNGSIAGPAVMSSWKSFFCLPDQKLTCQILLQPGPAARWHSSHGGGGAASRANQPPKPFVVPLQNAAPITAGEACFAFFFLPSPNISFSWHEWMGSEDLHNNAAVGIPIMSFSLHCSRRIPT